MDLGVELLQYPSEQKTASKMHLFSLEANSQPLFSKAAGRVWRSFSWRVDFFWVGDFLWFDIKVICIDLEEITKKTKDHDFWIQKCQFVVIVNYSTFG